jgi:hypothetical protein
VVERAAARSLSVWDGRNHRACVVHTFMQQVCANSSCSLACGQGSMSEAVPLLIMIACVLRIIIKMESKKRSREC